VDKSATGSVNSFSVRLKVTESSLHKDDEIGWAGVFSGMHERRSHQKPALRLGIRTLRAWCLAWQPGAWLGPRRVKTASWSDGAYLDRTGDLRLAKSARDSPLVLVLPRSGLIKPGVARRSRSACPSFPASPFQIRSKDRACWSRHRDTEERIACALASGLMCG
jgi:hypothetical protein